MAVDRKFAGLFGIADPIKPNASAALQNLRSEGLRIVMLTGDNRTTADAVARRLEISEIEAEVRPDQKNRNGRKSYAARGAWSRWPVTA